VGDLCFQDHQRVLFIGDSITDCGRRDENAPFGNGYFNMLRGLIMGRWPERDITWVNKGIGGHTILDLQDRWEEDVIRQAPDWLGVKVGINDLHQFLQGGARSVPPPRFRQAYQEMLKEASAKIKPGLILITPFYISLDRSHQSDQGKVLRLLPEYLAVVEEMAAQFGARLVRLQPMFERQLRYRPADTVCPEPVHPNLTGHLLIAQEVLRVLCEE
jgi:lysophospholipase L1-like esterase